MSEVKIRIMDKLYILFLLITTGIIAIQFDNLSTEILDDSGQLFSYNKNKYLCLLCVVMYLIISMRDLSVGSDTYGYVKSFELLNTSNGILFYDRDPAFAILNYLLRHITSNGRIYLFLVSWPLPLSFYLLMKDEKQTCKFVYLGFVLLLLLEIFAFSMAGIRQTIAIFFTVLAYKFLDRDKIIGFLISIAIGATFHLSSILFLLVLPLRKLKFGVLHIALLIAFLIIVKVNPGQMLSFVTSSTLGESYWTYGTVYKSDASYTMMIIQISLLCLLLVDRRILCNSATNTMLLNNAWLGIIAGACSPIIAEFFRIAFYFSIYLCLLIPKVLLNMEENNKRICCAGVIMCTILYMVIFTNPLAGYKFFW